MSFKRQLKQFLYIPHENELIDIIDDKLSESRAESILTTIDNSSIPIEVEEISFDEQKSGVSPISVKFAYRVTYLR